MNNKKNDTKLYNVIFPLWVILMIPQAWLIVLPGNFIIDSIVLIISMIALKISGKMRFYIRHIFIVFGFGLLADIIGSAFMFIMTYLFHMSVSGDELYMTIPALLISAGAIYLLNYHVTFRKQEKFLKFRLALIFAIATAPYTFLVPTSWMYNR